MDFVTEPFSIKLLSVMKVDWKQNNNYVLRRPYCAISFRIKGNATFTDTEHSVQTKDNDVVFMPDGVNYHLVSQEEQLVVIHFELLGKKQNSFEVFSPTNPEAFSDLFETVCGLWLQKNPGYYIKCTNILHRLIEMLFFEKQELAKHTDYEKLKPAIFYMQKNFSDSELTVSSLCRLLNVSDTYFRRMFLSVYNTTPIKYINELRISHAEEFLATGFYTVEQVAEMCGFNDAKYFSVVFKKLRGYSPCCIKPRSALLKSRKKRPCR